MLISGAAAGMAAVFRAPLTGIVFALEMPYKDDLAHEALVAVADCLGCFLRDAGFVSGHATRVRLPGGHKFAEMDLLWSAVLGLICGLVAMMFAITFRPGSDFCGQLACLTG